MERIVRVWLLRLFTRLNLLLPLLFTIGSLVIHPRNERDCRGIGKLAENSSPFPSFLPSVQG